MRKTKRFALMLLMAATVLGGCGGEVTSPKEMPTTTTIGQETEAVIETTKEETEPENLYETSELITKTVGDIEYQVPKGWEEDSEEIDGGVCYYDNGLIIIIMSQEADYESLDELFEQEAEEDVRKALLDGMSGGFQKYKEISTTSGKILGVTSFRYKADAVIDETEYFMDVSTVAFKGNMYSFQMLVEKESGMDYSDEFESLIGSVSANEPEETKDSAFNIFKNNISENTMELEFSDSTTALMIGWFSNNFYAVKGSTSFEEIVNSEEDNKRFREFVMSISYFDTYFKEGTVGKEIGEKGWTAIKSIMTGDGDFQKNMDDLKSTYELLPDNRLFEKKYESGQYKVGVDIEPGEYVFFTDTSRGYFSVSSDANGSDIIANGNFAYNSIMTIRDGEYLELSGCYAVPIDGVAELPIDQADMFKIGVHLPAGEYKLVTDGDRGYYCIYSDDRQRGIEANDNFDGQSYIMVSDGQYLALSRCHIEQ